jgi:hypothetical protein
MEVPTGGRCLHGEDNMDPITTAIVAALPAVASDLVKSSVKDAYDGLKAVIRRKWGDASALAKAVEDLEAKPKSKGQALVLEEEVADVKATEDAEVMKALAKLVSELKDAKIGGEAVASINIHISGGTVQGVVGAREVTVGSMNFSAPPEKRS